MVVVDDHTVRERFATLNRSINEWVLTHLKHGRPVPPPPHVLAYLRETQPEYEQLIHNDRARYLVLRSVVGDLIARAIGTGDIHGNEQFVTMRNHLSKSGMCISF